MADIPYHTSDTAGLEHWEHLQSVLSVNRFQGAGLSAFLSAHYKLEIFLSQGAKCRDRGVIIITYFMFFSVETFLLLTQSQPFRCCQFPSFLIKILENHDILSPDITARESSANINIWQLYLAENVCIHIHIMLVGQDIKMVINIKYIRTTLLPCTTLYSILKENIVALILTSYLGNKLWHCDSLTLWHCDEDLNILI